MHMPRGDTAGHHFRGLVASLEPTCSLSSSNIDFAGPKYVTAKIFGTVLAAEVLVKARRVSTHALYHTCSSEASDCFN